MVSLYVHVPPAAAPPDAIAVPTPIVSAVALATDASRRPGLVLVEPSVVDLPGIGASSYQSKCEPFAGTETPLNRATRRRSKGYPRRVSRGDL